MSLKQGFVKEAVSVCTWFFSGVMAWLFGPSMVELFSRYIETSFIQALAGYSVVFIFSLLTGSAIKFLLGELIKVIGLSSADRLFGLLFGLARGSLFVSLAVGLLSMGKFDEDIWWKESALLPTFLLIAEWCQNFILGFSARCLDTSFLYTFKIPST